jgi:hypothetical protein
VTFVVDGVGVSEGVMAGTILRGGLITVVLAIWLLVEL